MSALEEMIELEVKLKRRLEENPDFRAWIALKKAIDDLRPAQISAMTSHAHYYSGGLVHTIASLSQADATIIALRNRGVPTEISELLPLVMEQGVQVGGANKEVNLSSALSRDKRLRSIRWNGKYFWWFRDVPYRGEPDFQAREEEMNTQSENEAAYLKSSDVL